MYDYVKLEVFPLKKLSPKAKKIIAAVVLVVLAIIVTLTATFALQHVSGPARVVKTFFTSFNDRDFDAFCGCYMPSDQVLLKEAAEKLGGSEAFFEKNQQSMFGDDTPYSDFGDDIRLSVSDLDTESQTIENNMYNGLNLAEMKVTAVSTVDCTVTTKGSGNQAEERLRVVCFKISGKWYIYTMAAIPEQTVSPTDVQ